MLLSYAPSLGACGFPLHAPTTEQGLSAKALSPLVLQRVSPDGQSLHLFPCPGFKVQGVLLTREKLSRDLVNICNGWDGASGSNGLCLPAGLHPFLVGTQPTEACRPSQFAQVPSSAGGSQVLSTASGQAKMGFVLQGKTFWC